MAFSTAIAEKIYRLYLDFLDAAERKRSWSIFRDIPWNKLDPLKNTERIALCIETFCSEEFYLPDYTVGGIELTRSIFGAAWFQARWSYEESKHGLVFREYLTRSGMRSQAEIASLEKRLFDKTWRLPFKTSRQMACYGALQEAATYLAYKAQKDLAIIEGNEVLAAIFMYVSRDEAAHAGFYRGMVEFELEEDRQGTLDDLAHVVSCFKMPGDGLIADYQERLRTSGAGISTRLFLQHGLLPTLKTFGTTSAELKSALNQGIATKTRKGLRSQAGR